MVKLDSGSTNDTEANKAPPPRPALLGSLIDFQKEQSDAFDEKFLSFLQMAWLAQRYSDSSPISITANTHQKDEVEQPCFQDRHTASRKLVEEVYNSSFRDLFEFYARFSLDGVGRSFSDIDTANNTLSHVEFETFFRDFNVIPRLITCTEMNRIWADMSQHRVDVYSDKPLLNMDIDDAQEFLVRVALYIFSAVGMRKAVLATTGKVSTPSEMVQYLLHYSRIDDSVFVKEHLRVGRHRQTQAIMLDEVDATRHVHVAREAADDLKFKQFDAADGNSTLQKEIALKARNTMLANGCGSNKRVSNASRSRRSPLKKFESEPKVPIPAGLRAMLDDPSNTHRMNEPKKKKDVQGMEMMAAADGKKKSAEGAAKAAAEEDNNKNENCNQEVTCTRLEDPYNNYMELYHPNLLDDLAAYCEPKLIQPVIKGIHASCGAFCDVGHIMPGTLNSVRLMVHNRSPEDLKIDVQAIDFGDDNAEVTHSPKALVPGLSRQIDITFRAPYSPRSAVGNIQLHLRGLNAKYSDEINIPVFFYTSAQPVLGSNRDLIPCRKDNLEKYIEKYLGKGCLEKLQNNPINKSANLINFDTQKSLSLSSIDNSVSVTAHNNGERGEAAKLGVSFVKTRNAWYGNNPVGGGGKPLSSFGSQFSNPMSNPYLQKRAMTATMTSSGARVAPLVGKRLQIDDDDDMTINTDITWG